MCNHWSNLRPILGEDNVMRHNREDDMTRADMITFRARYEIFKNIRPQQTAIINGRLEAI
jgi:hypothetical protein